LFNIHKSINIQHIKARKRIITSPMDAGKATDKIQHLFMIKSLKKLGIEGS
jgi:hypothetical protein